MDEPGRSSFHHPLLLRFFADDVNIILIRCWHNAANIVTIRVFNDLSIGSGLVAAVGMWTDETGGYCTSVFL